MPRTASPLEPVLVPSRTHFQHRRPHWSRSDHGMRTALTGPFNFGSAAEASLRFVHGPERRRKTPGSAQKMPSPSARSVRPPTWSPPLQFKETESVPRHARHPRGWVAGKAEVNRGGVSRQQTQGTSVHDIKSSAEWPRRRSVLRCPRSHAIRRQGHRHDVDLGPRRSRTASAAMSEGSRISVRRTERWCVLDATLTDDSPSSRPDQSAR